MNIHFISAFAESEFMHSFLRNTTLTDKSCPHIPEFLSTACPGHLVSLHSPVGVHLESPRNCTLVQEALGAAPCCQDL